MVSRTRPIGVILPAYPFDFIPTNTFHTEYPKFHSIPSAWDCTVYELAEDRECSLMSIRHQKTEQKIHIFPSIFHYSISFSLAEMKLSSSKSDWEIWIKVAQLQQQPKLAKRSNISWLKCIVASAVVVCDRNGIIQLLIILGIYEGLSERRTARMQMVVSNGMALELIKIIQTSTFGSWARQTLWVTGLVALTKDRVHESRLLHQGLIWDIKCT